MLNWVHSFFATDILWETKIDLLLCAHALEQSLKNSLMVYYRFNLNFQFETYWCIIKCLSYLRRSHHDNRKQRIRRKTRYCHLSHRCIYLLQMNVVKKSVKVRNYDQFHISKLFDVLLNFFFTTSETMSDYY